MWQCWTCFSSKPFALEAKAFYILGAADSLSWLLLATLMPVFHSGISSLYFTSLDCVADT